MHLYNPPHPGSILKEDILSELDISITDADNQLGLSRVRLSRVILIDIQHHSWEFGTGRQSA